MDLYDYLEKKAEENSGMDIDIKLICSTINNIADYLPDEEAKKHYEVIGILALHYEHIKSGNLVLSGVPKGGKVIHGGKGILCSLPEFDVKLQRIIAQYLDECSIPLEHGTGV